jgi:uncharacterized protein (TIGR03435 family)
MRSFICAGALTLLAGAASGQSGSAPKFDVADVRVNPKAPNTFMRTSPSRNGRYEIKNATMLDLVRTAYGFNPDTILGGPNWLELDRFDVIAKVAAGADTEAQKAMLQSLLEDRFKLVARKETKPVPSWVLAAGKQPRLKEADGSGQTGCQIPDTSSGAPAEGVIRLFRMEPDGKQTQINLAPGGIVQYSCRNMTMAAFAAELRRMLGVQVGQEPVVDETGLKGAWNFDVKWSIGLIGLANQGEQIPVADAIDRQLGLKLEQRPIPKPVLVIESVSRTPTPNPANVAEVLPTPPAPKEFEVADVKAGGAPSPSQPPMISMQMQPGGRFTCRGCPMRLLLSRAFNSNNEPGRFRACSNDRCGSMSSRRRHRTPRPAPESIRRHRAPLAQPARRSVQDGVSRGGAPGHRILADCRETETEESGSGQPDLLQTRPSCARLVSGVAAINLPERDDGVLCRATPSGVSGVELAGTQCNRPRRRVGLLLDLQRAPARAVECRGTRRSGRRGRAIWRAAFRIRPRRRLHHFRSHRKAAWPEAQGGEAQRKGDRGRSPGNHTD